MTHITAVVEREPWRTAGSVFGDALKIVSRDFPMRERRKICDVVSCSFPRRHRHNFALGYAPWPVN